MLPLHKLRKSKYYSESWKYNNCGVGAQAGTNPDTKFGKTGDSAYAQCVLCMFNMFMFVPMKTLKISSSDMRQWRTEYR